MTFFIAFVLGAVAAWVLYKSLVDNPEAHVIRLNQQWQNLLIEAHQMPEPISDIYEARAHKIALLVNAYLYLYFRGEEHEDFYNHYHHEPDAKWSH